MPNSFCSLKDMLITVPIMQPPYWFLPFVTMRDASDYTIGVVLGQRREKKLNVVYYASKTLNDVQITRQQRRSCNFCP